MNHQVQLLKDIYEQKGIEALIYALENANDLDPCSLAEIGVVLGVSRERIRQIERNALKKLKHPKNTTPLKSLQEALAHEQQLQADENT